MISSFSAERLMLGPTKSFVIALDKLTNHSDPETVNYKDRALRTSAEMMAFREF